MERGDSTPPSTEDENATVAVAFFYAPFLPTFFTHPLNAPVRMDVTDPRAVCWTTCDF